MLIALDTHEKAPRNLLKDNDLFQELASAARGLQELRPIRKQSPVGHLRGRAAAIRKRHRIHVPGQPRVPGRRASGRGARWCACAASGQPRTSNLVELRLQGCEELCKFFRHRHGRVLAGTPIRNRGNDQRSIRMNC